jgi:hypothetical protein
MSEDQFRQRSPLGGEVLHAHLDIWKSGETWPKSISLPGSKPGTLKGASQARMPVDDCPALGSSPLPQPRLHCRPQPPVTAGFLGPGGSPSPPPQPWPSPQNCIQSTQK